MQSVLYTCAVSGVYDGKPYKGARILLGTVKDDKLAYVKLYKCPVEVYEALRGKPMPITNIEPLFDSYGNIAVIHTK